MALVLQAYTFAQQYVASYLHPTPTKSPMGLKLGVISTAQINPAAIIHPAETHPDVILYGIASRDLETAKQAAQKYNFKKAYGSYQDLIDDPEIDFVYISTPNGLHYEWASKALRAGKHVLCEKPFTSNAEEARKLVELAKVKGLVCEEAFHWQFHPSAHLFREILDSGRYGRILRTSAIMTASPGVPDGDIRWQFELSGGSSMDMTYALSFTRFAVHGAKLKEVQSAVARPYAQDKRVDEAMHSLILFEDPKDGHLIQSRIYTDMARQWVIKKIVPRVWEFPSIEVETDKAIIYYYNAMMPHLYHYISITDKTTGKTEYKKQYKGGPCWGESWTTGGKGGKAYWSTYRYQLEAFTEKVRGKHVPYWISGEESIAQMEAIDAIYKIAGLPTRPSVSKEMKS
ncbi:NAD binding Rossmann fold oxidoreductase, putative [Talaromyces stipitatus ATCC 10500]|uniref:D-xylose 1-dehydrogenase (NADP(+), D-xylono-1,5-lactone-forming) n=1 Tax=Talaromyces stipitatus (strain ATCC 10500 / CBS 375.48 / QM 6759 / NRRL 1006) TaxID=441959 RepID=B8LWX0_TALSN|nr:NAD binding Rossmann fold oxidoreductase, putative [Talaromyces stipitatus ATCC 10500]EED24603.1 NAD binding Rossmann fold oxidoreductase, putative [Talaromyces stipitatus ATCC 10500]